MGGNFVKSVPRGGGGLRIKILNTLTDQRALQQKLEYFEKDKPP